MTRWLSSVELTAFRLWLTRQYRPCEVVASSKPIRSGLRYFEQFKLSLVQMVLEEHENMLRTELHIRPLMRFVRFIAREGAHANKVISRRTRFELGMTALDIERPGGSLTNTFVAV